MNLETDFLAALAGYCAQAERCIDDVRKKMKNAGLTEDAEKRIIDRLLQEKFIDERRFCRSFVNDKLKFNRWGRIKTTYELKRKNIKPEIYSEALEAIDENEYISVLSGLLKSKKHSVKGRSTQDVFQKIYRFASSRGFEPPLIVKTLQELLGNMDYDADFE